MTRVTDILVQHVEQLSLAQNCQLPSYLKAEKSVSAATTKRGPSDTFLLCLHRQQRHSDVS